jgi:hypothetical protein
MPAKERREKMVCNGEGAFYAGISPGDAKKNKFTFQAKCRQRQTHRQNAFKLAGTALKILIPANLLPWIWMFYLNNITPLTSSASIAKP